MNTTAKILIVDDETNILHSLKRLLHGKYIVDTAVGGQEALEMINTNNHTYSVVISDMNMPGMDGIELLRSIKTHSPDTIRVMLTGNAKHDTVKNAVINGEVFRFMTKPCQRSELIKVIEEALEYFHYCKKNG